MKTKKLIKRTAAFCLTLAGFCAVQSVFAEVTVPEWKNSYISTPNTAFYLYNTAKSKFATNSLTLLEDESKATVWTYSSKKLSTNGKFLNRNTWTRVLEFSSSSADFPLDYGSTDGTWGIYWSNVINTEHYYIYANSDSKMEFGSKNTPIYEWYFISESQWNNHFAIVEAKKVVDEANDYLNKAEESEAKTALAIAINNAETIINNANIEEADAKTAISNAAKNLNDALDAYKATILGQLRTDLAATVEEANDYPSFGFFTNVLEAANAALQNENSTATALDKANKDLKEANAKAKAIVESEEYRIYLDYKEQISDNNAKAAVAGYTGYDAATSTTAIATAEANLLKIEAATELTEIYNTLKPYAEQTARDYAHYAGAEAVVRQAAKVGYTADLAAIKAATVSGLPDLIDGIRDEAKKGVFNYIANYEDQEPIDMTIYIKNNSFELGDVTGWTLEKSGDNTGVKFAESDYHTTGVDGAFLFNTKENGSILTGYYPQGYGIYQKLEGLPNGKYRLEALLTSSTLDDKTYLTVNTDNNQTRMGDGVSSPSDSEFAEAAYEFDVTNGTVTIGAIGIFRVTFSSWFRADNFRLTLLSRAATFDEAVAYAYTSEPLPVVKVSREIKANQWTTLCLPMECTKPESLTLYEVTAETKDESDKVSVTVAASNDTKIQAGKPYIVKNADVAISEFISNGVSLVEAPKTAGEFIPFTGLFTTTELNAGDIYVSTSADNAEGDKPVYKSLSETASNKNMKGFRAYFQVPAETAESSVRFVTEGDLTGIMQAIEEQQTATGIYDLSGRKASTLQKGIYVIDGKKIIIK